MWSKVASYQWEILIFTQYFNKYSVKKNRSKPVVQCTFKLISKCAIIRDAHNCFVGMRARQKSVTCDIAFAHLMR